MRQPLDGVGGAWTDTAAWLLLGNRTQPSDPPALTPAQRAAVLTALFDAEQGLGLRAVRLPMGTSDFRWSDFTYEDVPGRFSIGRDLPYIVPALQATLALQPGLLVFALPWSAPAWLKTPATLYGGTLRADVDELYSQYFADFVQAYAAQNIPIHAVSLQNEPGNANSGYPTMLMEPADQARLAPLVASALDRAGHGHVKLLVYDHNWDNVAYPLAVLRNASAAPSIDGVAFHW